MRSLIASLTQRHLGAVRKGTRGTNLAPFSHKQSVKTASQYISDLDNAFENSGDPCSNCSVAAYFP